VTTTTLGKSFHVGITHRTGLISSEHAERFARRYLQILDSVCWFKQKRRGLQPAGPRIQHGSKD